MNTQFQTLYWKNTFYLFGFRRCYLHSFLEDHAEKKYGTAFKMPKLSYAIRYI